ncbi:hypothetical protein [Afifella sp. YEN Y35]|uniref:hypothetical protein n=1 Tax=Afifella sp. YEN Y35 TaxID=3388337 RepID=UPI0039DF9166
MPIRYRHAAIAIGTFLSLQAPCIDRVLASNLGQDNRAESAEQHPERDEFSIPVRIVEPPEEREARHGRDRESDQRERDDLIAQNRAAEASIRSAELAWWQSFWTFFQTLLVAVGTIAIVWTLFETRKAVEAASNTVVVTREIGEAQVRAYLTCNGANYRRSENGIKVSVELTNNGQSPASDIKVRGRIIFPTPAISPKFPFDSITTVSRESHNICGVIPAGGTGETFLTWRDDEISGVPLFDGAHPGRVTGAIYWQDVFDKTQSLRFNLWRVGDEQFLEGERIGRFHAFHDQHEDGEN